MAASNDESNKENVADGEVEQIVTSDQNFILWIWLQLTGILFIVHSNFTPFVGITLFVILDHYKFSYTVFLAESTDMNFFLLKITILCHINTVLLIHECLAFISSITK